MAFDGLGSGSRTQLGLSRVPREPRLYVRLGLYLPSLGCGLMHTHPER